MNETKTTDLKKSKFSKICEIREKKNGYINPVLVTFQNGEISAEYENDMKVTLSPQDDGTSVEVQSSSGDIYQEVNFGKSTGKQFIAVHNKKTKKVRIVEVDKAILIHSALVNPKSGNELMDSVDYGKDISKLNKTFGGKKIRSRLQQREKLNVNSALVADELKEAVEVIKQEANKTETSDTIETDSIIELLPPCNRHAKNVVDVYILSEILSEEELESLKNEVLSRESKEKLEDNNEDSLFFKFCYNNAKKSKDNLQDRLAGLLFIEVLIKFLKTPTKQLASRRTVFCSFSNAIHSKILNEFCIKSGSSISRPFSMRDKTLCYIIAITLICCGFEINLKHLALVSSVHLNRIIRLAKVVGATPLSKDEVTFVLQLPLPSLPKLSMPKRKK